MSLNRIISSLYRYKKKIAILLVLTCFGSSIYFLRNRRSALSSLKTMECSHTESMNMIKELCSLYKHGKVIGNMCPTMCTEGNIMFERCLNYKDGKHVLLVDCFGSCELGKDVQAVLKMNHLKFGNIRNLFNRVDHSLLDIFTYINVFDKNVHFLDHLIDYRDLVQKVEKLIHDEYGVTIEKKNILRTLMGENYETFQVMNDDNPAYPINFVRTLWSLLDQNEYKTSVLFNRWKLFPKIYGFCGPVYLSQYAPFNEKLDRRLKKNGEIMWRKRATTAIHILNLIHVADSLKPPLHFCDVKTPHFGTTVDGEIVFTDSDTVFTNNTLGEIFKATPCNKDEDCAFFDCLGKCDKNSRKCFPYRVNSNLQSACSRVLQEDESNVFEGILANPIPKVAKQIQELLQDCSSSSIEKKVQGQSPEDWIVKMKQTLLESLDYD